MKIKLLFAASFIFVTWAVTSCEALSDCKFCKSVTYENSQVVSETGETEYCGADLITEEAKADLKVGSLTTKVECRH